MRLLELGEKKSLVLDILNEIDVICENNGIQYFLAYGTLIGAIRHQGFIPWDDDIDIWVPIEHYTKLLHLLEVKSKYTLINNLTNRDWPRPFSKLSNENTIVVDKKSDALNLHRGISVDIFPLGRFANRDIAYDSARKMISRISSIYLSRKEIKAKSIKNMLVRAAGKYNLLLSKDELYWQNKLLTIQNDSDGKYRGFLGSKYREKDIVDASYYEETIEVSFEGKLYPAPAKYDLLLKSIYGDYMKLPPKDKQVSNHDVEVYLLED